MGYFRKLCRKIKKKVTWKRHSSAVQDQFHTIDTEFGHISENCQGNDVFENQDCLVQVLSFLTCKELAVSARTCKALQHAIFESSNKDVNINMIWHGAEMELVKPYDRLGCFPAKRRLGANVREHCHLFVMASKAAERYEQSAEMDEIEDDRMMVDGVLSNLMKVRRFDAEGVAKKKAMAKGLRKRMDDDAFIRMLCNHDRLMKRNDKRCKMLNGQTSPKRSYHHAVFVRVTRASTEEMICQGFCERTQKLPWDAGLEFSDKNKKQGLDVWLDFSSLKQSEEIQSYLESYSASVARVDEEPSLGFHVTAVVVNRKDGSCQCLFQQDLLEDVKRLTIGRISKFGRKFKRHCFDLEPLWGTWGDADIVQLGPSPYVHTYSLKFALSLNTIGSLVVPVLEVFIEPERTDLFIEMLRRADQFVDNIDEVLTSDLE